MKYNIRGQRMEVTLALREYVEKKLSRLERYLEAPPLSDAQVTLSATKGLHAVEVTIPLTSVLLRAEVKSEDMYASIDLVTDKLERQIRKHKTKVNRKFRQDGSSRALFKEEYGTGSRGAAALATFEEEDEYELVRTKRFNLKPMDVEEAILQMNMVGHNFYVFANSDTREVNVVYRRSDGRYGLIESAE
ncbi:ribosome hibernation-promoting factor, HPF/YfiA family [Cohnella thailandensis]|jgi:ribosomal subunit interface protein|uniref:Ribosome hibernation promoting factor n=1 Tax=Cohnella thailandensis TaxID=557557 RepID=A0A841SQY7_9BACL|nr:ribosome-associated translation inhibitor RaiA [Cohnella thailandensis]MBB6632558.1 ribosome-associated translation inhibitor RaiA [Cohnella thailandensis]MBP1971852.1 putative sigma-54 modulation protein [Cohnella thailandensis]